VDTLIALYRSTGHYLGQMAMLALPVAVVFYLLTPLRQRRLRKLNLTSGTAREICLMLFVMSVCGILSVTLRPPAGWGSPLPEKKELWENLNLIPFRMFRIYGYYLRWGNFLYILINFIGNMLVFLPLGFFPALLFRKARWWRSVLIGGGISAFVEFGQFFLMRQSDIDDVLLNALGALLGYWTFLLLRKIAPTTTSRFQCS
jgi:glycopeptide antibiotics resistance protein